MSEELFRKQILIQKGEGIITHRDSILSIGSCFSENIGDKLSQSRFNVKVNPYGIIFNPIALSKLFDQSIVNNGFENNQSSFSNWSVHSKLNGYSKIELEKNVRTATKSFDDQMKAAEVVMVTFGTAWGYYHLEKEITVANCHKMPQQLFEKRLSSVKDIVEKWQSIITSYSDKKWIFTVSPVRHWKDGVRENNVSKGVLHQSIHELLKLNNVDYFPSYELVMDELRDYRFFERDMLHPNQIAIDFIWEKFMETYFNYDTTSIVRKVEKLNKMESHKTDKANNKFELKKQVLREDIESLLEKG